MPSGLIVRLLLEVLMKLSALVLVFSVTDPSLSVPILSDFNLNIKG